MLLLEVNGLSCHDPAGRRRVLRDVTIGIGRGSFVGLLGGSGAGKSTLARCIAGLQRADSGRILFDGKEIAPSAGLRQPAIQMVFQSATASLDPMLSIYDSLREAVEAAGVPRGEWPSTIYGLVTAVGLSEEHLRRRPDQLSGGQRQRVAIARTLAVRPALLILDEPTSALDLITQRKVMALLLSLRARNDFAILFITQDTGLALSLCEKIAILHEGTIIEDGSAEQITRTPRHEYTRRLIQSHTILSAGAFQGTKQ